MAGVGPVGGGREAQPPPGLRKTSAVRWTAAAEIQTTDVSSGSVAALQLQGLRGSPAAALPRPCAGCRICAGEPDPALWDASTARQAIARTTPPSTRSAAPLVAEAAALQA